jgi:hypothetical protein
VYVLLAVITQHLCSFSALGREYFVKRRWCNGSSVQVVGPSKLLGLINVSRLNDQLIKSSGSRWEARSEEQSYKTSYKDHTQEGLDPHFCLNATLFEEVFTVCFYLIEISSDMTLYTNRDNLS